MDIALVLSGGGMYAAWEAGAWKALCGHFEPAMIVGTSAGAWIGWSIAGGCTPDDLIRDWNNPETAQIMRFGLHRSGCMRPEAFHAKARYLFERYRPRVPFALTITEAPSLRPKLVRDADITWRHLAATAAIPLCYPPVKIEGKLYVDGGLRGGLPLWGAQELGATHAEGLTVLNALPFPLLRSLLLRPRRANAGLHVVAIEPSEDLGPLLDSAVWSAKKIARWIEMGERDARRALSAGALDNWH